MDCYNYLGFRLLQSLLQFLTCKFHKEVETVTVAMITEGISTDIEIVV